MPPSVPNEIVCEICGAKIETTASGDLGCMACWLRAGLGETLATREATIPDSLGTYRIDRREDGTLWELGHGAMGVTYRAQDVSLRRPVALKLINADFAQRGAGGRDRFVREARAAASLRHPHVATVYQFGIDEETGQCFCAMELIEGETLDELVRRNGPLDAPAVLEIARQIVSALFLAEKEKVVHRDLKPGNIMIVASGEPEKSAVKIIDFGLAKAFGETSDARALTNGAFLGTPAFASPEQLKRATIDVRSDIYSLGATLWYLLTAQMPFGEQAMAEPPVAQLKHARVPAEFISLLVAMVAAEPAARPGAKELAARFAKLPRRPARRLLLLATAAILALAGGAFFLFYPRAVQAPPARAFPPPERSVAVLSFANLGDEKGGVNLADGVQDELLTDLARVSELKVVSRTSVLPYRGGQARNLREIAQQLGVAFVVEGTVQQIAHRVRISAQLIDARTDLHRWAQTYERPLDDVFAIQSEIAQTIAGQLHAKITKRSRLKKRPHTTLRLTIFTRA